MNVHDFLVMRGLTQLVLYSASGVLKIWFFSVVEVPTKQSSLCNKNFVRVNWRLYFWSVIPLSHLNHWFILDQKQSLSEERREEWKKKPIVGNKTLFYCSSCTHVTKFFVVMWVSSLLVLLSSKRFPVALTWVYWLCALLTEHKFCTSLDYWDTESLT